MAATPVRTGAALALTVGTGYAFCSLGFWIWPDAAATFMNSLFHGLDFRKLQAGPSLFSFDAFLYALATLMAWAFLLGALFGWIRSIPGLAAHDGCVTERRNAAAS